MKPFLTILFAFSTMYASAQINTLSPGDKAPDITLKNVNDKQISFADYANAKGFIVVFTCNTCPYAKAYEQRIVELHNKFASQGYPVIAINSNDPEVSGGDSFEKMKQLATSKKYPFPYLYDEGQLVTNAYGARNTPHIFLVRKTSAGNVVEYTGAIDNDSEDSRADKTKYVEQAIAALQNNSTPAVRVTKAIGCGVKRKKA